MLNAVNKIKTAFMVLFSSYLALITGNTTTSASVYETVMAFYNNGNKRKWDLTMIIGICITSQGINKTLKER